MARRFRSLRHCLVLKSGAKGVIEDDQSALPVPGLLAPEVADAFLRTLWNEVMAQRVPLQREQQTVLTKRALEVHGRNYTPLLALHWGLTSLVAEKTKLDLIPSFAWFRIYFEGDILRVHADRKACEVSASITLAYSDGQCWPLNIGQNLTSKCFLVSDDFGDEKYDTFAMNPGDGVLYCGSTRRHGRTTPNPNRWSAHAFLQWVQRDGKYQAEAFERLNFGAIPSPLIS